jgi:hypothetical protein
VSTGVATTTTPRGASTVSVTVWPRRIASWRAAAHAATSSSRAPRSWTPSTTPRTPGAAIAVAIPTTAHTSATSSRVVPARGGPAGVEAWRMAAR